MSDYRFDVALSFPGEYRHYVEKVDQELCGLIDKERVFYDRRYQAELARPNLDAYLQRIYHDHSRLLVVFLCREYSTKDWCRLEWRAVRDLIKTHREEDVMPFRFDDAHVEGVFSIDGYIDARKVTPEETAHMIYQRVYGADLGPIPTGLGKAYNLPELHRHYQARPELTERVKASLISGADQAVGLVGAGAKVGVCGMGGVGKSVLASAIAADEEVRRTFHDGVVWLTIGQSPNIQQRYAQIADAFGDISGVPGDIQRAKAHVKQLLANRDCLIVLDDVWQVEHASLLNVVGPHSSLLVTSRNVAVLRSLDAKIHEVDKFGPEQAVALLAEWARTPVDQLPPVAQEVAKECGYLPLALAMVGSMVERRPGNWQSGLERLKAADLRKIRGEFPEYQHTDLFRAIQVSIDWLSEQQRECYLRAMNS